MFLNKFYFLFKIMEFMLLVFASLLPNTFLGVDSIQRHLRSFCTRHGAKPWNAVMMNTKITASKNF